MTVRISEVIAWKFDEQPGMTTRDGAIIQFPGGIPSQEDQATWTVEYEAHLVSTQYQQDRVYPSIGDQLDMQYWDQVNDTTTWKDTIAAVKAAHPKPE
jgi:hypothetical protein